MHKIFIVNCVAHHMRWYWVTVAIVAIIIGGLTYAGLSLLVVHSPYEKIVEKGDRVSVWYYGYIFIFILIITEKTLPKLGISWDWFKDFRKITVFLIMIWVAGITLISGGMYLWKNRKIIKSL